MNKKDNSGLSSKVWGKEEESNNNNNNKDIEWCKPFNLYSFHISDDENEEEEKEFKAFKSNSFINDKQQKAPEMQKNNLQRFQYKKFDNSDNKSPFNILSSDNLIDTNSTKFKEAMNSMKKNFKRTDVFSSSSSDSDNCSNKNSISKLSFMWDSKPCLKDYPVNELLSFDFGKPITGNIVKNNCQFWNNLNFWSNPNMSAVCNSTPSNICSHHNHNVHEHWKQNTNKEQEIQRNLNEIGTEITSVHATKIISNHCNSDNSNSNSNINSEAITTLTSSSFGLPVPSVTVLESPKLSSSGMHNWQAHLPSLKDRMATILNTDILADVYFIVGKKVKTRFSAHKFILSIGSAVFDAMFNGLLAKRNDFKNNDSEKLEIELPDIEPDAFNALLRFIYLDEVNIGPETVMGTLYVAKKYEVLALELACVNFLKDNLNPENAFMLLSQALLFDEINLADLCLDAIDKHTINALQSEYFLDIDITTLKMVLSRDTLRVREDLLFTAVLKWTEAECIRRNLEINCENKRLVLADALYLLRFPLMNIDEFASNAAQSGLLTDKEIVNLFLFYTVKTKNSIPFPFTPRCYITGEEYSVNRFERTESRWGYSGTSDRIRFVTNKTIFVIGFGLYGSIHGQAEYQALIEIMHTGSGKVLQSDSTTFTSNGTDSTFRVMFKYPVEISKDINYTACATLKGPDSYYGTNGCRALTKNLGSDDNKNIINFQFSYAAGCNNGTSVEDGQIPEIIFYV